MTGDVEHPEPFRQESTGLSSSSPHPESTPSRPSPCKNNPSIAEETTNKDQIMLPSLVFEHSHDSIFLLSLQGKVIDWNTGSERLLGYSKAEAIGQTTEVFLTLEASASLTPMLDDVLRYGHRQSDLEYVHKDGSQGVIEASIVLVCDEEQNPAAFLAINRDITERKRIEMDLRKFHRAVEQSPASIVITDTRGTIEYVNPKFTQVTGYTFEEALGNNPRVLKSGEMNGDVYRELWQTIKAGHEWRGEFHNRKKDGEYFWEIASISPIFDSEGNVTHFLAVKEDITDRKEVEAELQDAYQKLKLLHERMHDDLNMAWQIQQSLLPPARPGWCNLDVMCYCVPAREVGGDFYFYHSFETQIPLEVQRFVVAVGDVSGKGMPAALLMAVSLASFKTIITQSYSLNKILSSLFTDKMSSDRILADLDNALAPYTATTRQNCALVCVEIIRYVNADRPITMHAFNAGCIIPFVRRVDGSVKWVEAFGMPLGVGSGGAMGHESATLELFEGDMVILTSDGVVEAQNREREIFGFSRLEEAIALGPTDNASMMLDYLRTKLDIFVGNVEPHDDQTLVVIKI